MKTIYLSALAIGFSLLTVAGQAQVPGAPTQTVGPNATYQGGHEQENDKREHHPEIRKAQKHLEEAETNLREGAHDFGGHKEKAEQLIHEAQEQLNQALADDRH